MTNLFSKQSPWSCAAAAGAFALLFAACGDEVTEVTQVVGMQVLEEGDALPKCTADNEGVMVYSVDSAAAYTCIGRKWTSMKGKDGKDGVDGKDGKDGADGKNGENGKDGADGKNGKDGSNGTNGTNGSSESSCTAVAIDNGYKIVCGGDSVGVVLNGKDGAKGNPGVKGDSGATGNNGLSAYEIAKAIGFTGTEEEWITSLKGDPGVKGDSGATGNDGLSAYEIAKAIGFTGTEEEWIASLKGEQGVKGDTGVAGTSCSAEEVSDGVRITCTDGKSFTLKNGTDGKDGKSFVDDGWMIDLRDKQIYRAVTIGDQVWMAENLNYKVDSSWCGGGLDKTEGDCSKYGRLYMWAAAVGKSVRECGYGYACGLSGMVRGVCPEGWHLPDTTEWNKLFTAVGGKSTAGKKLKSQTGWNSGGSGTDAYGFFALPAGYRDFNGNFDTEGGSAHFWSATENPKLRAYGMDLYYNREDVSLLSVDKSYGYSVRCVKD